MKTTHFTGAAIIVGLLSCSPGVFAQNDELDLTITIIEEGETPEGVVTRIPFPTAQAIVESVPSEIDVNSMDTLSDDIVEDVNDSVNEVVETISETVSESIKDTISIDGIESVEELPEDIIDNLPEELPLTDENIDDVIDGLPETDLTEDLDVIDSISIDNEAMIEAAEEAAVETITESVDESVNDAMNDVIDDAAADEAIDELPTENIDESASELEALDAIDQLP